MSWCLQAAQGTLDFGARAFHYRPADSEAGVEEAWYVLSRSQHKRCEEALLPKAKKEGALKVADCVKRYEASLLGDFKGVKDKDVAVAICLVMHKLKKARGSTTVSVSVSLCLCLYISASLCQTALQLS